MTAAVGFEAGVCQMTRPELSVSREEGERSVQRAGPFKIEFVQISTSRDVNCICEGSEITGFV